MTTTQMLEELRKKSYEQLWRHGTNDEYILQNVAVIGSSPEVGFKSSLSRDEIEEAYGPEGLITSHIARSQKLHDRSQNRPTKAKKISQVSGVLYELVRSVYCNVAHGPETRRLVKLRSFPQPRPLDQLDQREVHSMLRKSQ